MKNIHGVEITPAEERLEDISAEIGKQLEQLQRMNAENADIDHTCVELAALHALFGRKHVIMRGMRGKRINLDCYAGKGDEAQCIG